VRVFGQETSAIRTGDEWLTIVDRFGIVSERAVLLEPFTPIQNLAMPFTLDVEPPSVEIRLRAESLAREVGLGAALWDRPLHELSAPDRLRVRLGRALALDPAIVLLEHPSATLDAADVVAVAESFKDIFHVRCGGRALAALTLTADVRFARDVATTVLELDPASGALRPLRRGWFGRGIRAL
jgi:ABC-type lipoprotein export system ATPase subunit